MQQTKAAHMQGIKSEAMLYMAMDVGQATIKVAFSPTGLRPRMRDVPGKDWKQLLLEIEQAKTRFGLPGDCRVLSCYEAGRSGFWLHRTLAAHGVESLVVDSSSIEVSRRRRQVKTDKLDAQKLLQMLARYHFGEDRVWSVIRVPDVSDEDKRRLHRERRRLKKEETGHRNRIRSLLALHGLEVKSLHGDFDAVLRSFRLSDGSSLPPGLLREIRRDYQRLSLAWEQLRDIEAEIARQIRQGMAGEAPVAAKLYRLCGVGRVSAWVLDKELFSWRTFKNRRELPALVGLVPTPHASGDLQRERGISKSGSGYLRSLMVELSWSWLRYQPESELSQWFWERFGRGGARQRKIGIVALARKLLIALWRWVEGDTLPRGAKLKA